MRRITRSPKFLMISYSRPASVMRVPGSSLSTAVFGLSAMFSPPFGFGFPALPCPALPGPAPPCHAFHLALPRLAWPCPAQPCPAVPCPALPCLALPRLAMPCLALPFSLPGLHHLELDHTIAPELGPIVAHTYKKSALLQGPPHIF